MNKVAVLSGDGIGPEVMAEALKVLDVIAKKYNHTFEFKEGYVGGIAYDKTGLPLPEETIQLCENSNAVLLALLVDLNGKIYHQKNNLKEGHCFL